MAEGTETLPTGIMLTSTGHTKKKRIGSEIGFCYYIGDIWKKDGKKTEYLNPIRSFYFFSDIKVCLLRTPGVSTGAEGFVVLKGSQPKEEQYAGGGEISEETKVFGFLYITVSQRVGPVGIHLGYIYGSVDEIVNPILSDVDRFIETERSLFLGIDTKFFNRRLALEAIYPEASERYILINTSIDRFLGFNLSFLKGEELTSIIGYFGIRLNLF
jgi:hypothetical protein